MTDATANPSNLIAQNSWRTNRRWRYPRRADRQPLIANQGEIDPGIGFRSFLLSRQIKFVILGVVRNHGIRHNVKLDGVANGSGCVGQGEAGDRPFAQTQAIDQLLEADEIAIEEGKEASP